LRFAALAVFLHPSISKGYFRMNRDNSAAGMAASPGPTLSKIASRHIRRKSRAFSQHVKMSRPKSSMANQRTYRRSVSRFAPGRRLLCLPLFFL